MTESTGYIPALSIGALTAYYDAAMATVFQEQRFRLPLVQRLAVPPGGRVLDVGCGTGTLALLVAQHTPAALVAGLDIDPVMVARAQAKLDAAVGAGDVATEGAPGVRTGQRSPGGGGLSVAFALGSAAVLPYPDATFDCVVSSLMLHHLDTPLKRALLGEAWRVLVAGGVLRILDFGPLGSGPVAAGIANVFGHFERVDDNLHGRVPGLLTDAGFVEVATEDIAFGGVIKLYGGAKPRR
jgi:ubiquinone/menaquinone biosynthesis C-methylase UbiE